MDSAEKARSNTNQFVCVGREGGGGIVHLGLIAILFLFSFCLSFVSLFVFVVVFVCSCFLFVCLFSNLFCFCCFSLHQRAVVNVLDSGSWLFSTQLMFNVRRIETSSCTDCPFCSMVPI